MSLFLWQVFFEKVFLTRPWKALFVTTDDDIREWWFRWRLDRYRFVPQKTNRPKTTNSTLLFPYSMLFGFCFAFVTAVGQRFKLFDDSPSCALWPRPVSALVLLGGAGGMLGYLVFALYCGGKVECNEIHPYLTVVPVR